MRFRSTLKNVLVATIFAMVLLLPAMDSKAATPEEEAVKYTYEVTPICGQMGYFLYLKTDNPDVSTLCLVDEANPKGVYTLSSNELFVDVKYENESTFRVPGGYIFGCTNNSTADTSFKTLEAGYFRLKAKKQNSIDKAVDTGIRIAHPKLYDSVDYILDTYTDSSMDFWAKMEAAQAGVMKIALYPFGIYDLNHPKDGVYPRIARSMYNDRTSSEIYPLYTGAFETVNALIYNAFPYMRNSASTPFLMSNIATRLEPNCTYELSEASHAYVMVTWNGKTDSYGGTGEHGNNSIVLDEKIYTFDGSENDYSQNKSIMDYRAKLAKVREEGGPKYSAAASGNGSLVELQKKGGWSSIYSFFGVDFIFYANPYYDTRVFNTWVDGRYVSEKGFYTLNGEGNKPTFKDHPDANIFLRNVTFTNAKGETLTEDVYYEYVPIMDKWYSFSAYDGKYSRWAGKEGGLPDELILTREEVEKMNLDYASGKAPEYYRIYDGTVMPGTEASVVNVTGLSFAQDRVEVIPTTGQADIRYVDVILSPNTGNKIYNIKRNTEKEAPECEKIKTFEPGQGGAKSNQIDIYSVASDLQPGEYKLCYTTYDGNHTAELTVVVGDGKGAVGQFVDRLYRVCLGREADAAGKANWVRDLESKKITGVKAAYGFVFSPEFKGMNLCDADYVEYLYEAFMGRSSDAGGKENWVKVLRSGKTREEVFNGFALSKEFLNICNSYNIPRGDAVAIPKYGTVPTGSCSVCGETDGITSFVTRLYDVCLDRKPDEAGLNDWAKQLRTHTSSGYKVAYGFVFSKEFQNKKLNDADYVEYMYKAFFGRKSDPAGKADWINRLKNGASRKDIFDGFTGSKEFITLCGKYGITVK